MNYKVFVPQRDEIQATKVLNNPIDLCEFMSSDFNWYTSGDSFQKNFLREQHKLLWQNEKMEDLGDFVLLFPNPDKREADKMVESHYNSIKLDDA